MKGYAPQFKPYDQNDLILNEKLQNEKLTRECVHECSIEKSSMNNALDDRAHTLNKFRIY